MDERAAALLVGPAILLAALWWIGAEAATFQLIGMFYPVTVCGAALLLIQARRASLATAVIIFSLASTYVLARVPRFLGTAERYASTLLQDRVYTAEMLNQIRKFAGNAPILIDTSSPQMARLFRGFSPYPMDRTSLASVRPRQAMATRNAGIFGRRSIRAEKHDGRRQWRRQRDGHLAFTIPHPNKPDEGMMSASPCFTRSTNFLRPRLQQVASRIGAGFRRAS